VAGVELALQDRKGSPLHGIGSSGLEMGAPDRRGQPGRRTATIVQAGRDRG